MDNIETKTAAQKKPGTTGAIIFIVVLIAGIAFLVWRMSRQSKIDATMKKVREAKANKTALDNVGETE